jgi:hypothetical protein
MARILGITVLFPLPMSEGVGNRDWMSSWPPVISDIITQAYLRPLWKPKIWIQVAPRWLKTWTCLEGGAPREGMEALCPFPQILPYASLPSGCSSESFLISFIINEQI